MRCSSRSTSDEVLLINSNLLSYLPLHPDCDIRIRLGPVEEFAMHARVRAV